MPTILSIQKQSFFPTDSDYLDAAHYLGYKKANPPEAQIFDLIKAGCNQLFEVITPKAVYDCFDLSIEKESPETSETSNPTSQRPKISFADVNLYSQSLVINLKDCSKVFLAAVTIGPQVDALIRRTQSLDSVKASILQAAGAMFAEKTICFVNDQIKQTAAEQNTKCKPRFSPGYGDVDLAVQKDFFRLLPCAKIGLSLMDTMIMSPEKSITAFIGMI